MSKGSSQSPLDAYADYLREWASQGVSKSEMARRITAMGQSTTKDSVNRALKRLDIPYVTVTGLPEPGLTLHGDEAILTGGEIGGPRLTPDELIVMRGLNPDDWDIKDIVINEYDAMMGAESGNAVRPMYQIKIYLTRKKPIEFVFPGKVPTDYKPPAVWRIDSNRPLLKVICGDGQVPFNDKPMEDCFLQFLADVRPDELIDIGDQADNPSVSTHAKNVRWHASINECIQATVDMNYHRRRASENTEYTILIGNHDIRLENFIVSKAEALYGIKQGDIPNDPDTGKSVLEWAYLTRARDLGINVVATGGDQYKHQSFKLVDHPYGALAEHGHATGQNHAKKMVERRMVSVFYGHTHDQTIATKTVYDIDGNHRTIYSVNIGTQAKIKGGLGYAKNPDWVNGFATLTDHGDGRFHVDLAKYEDGVLYWRDKRYFANPQLL